jgi:RNA polymerase-binding transcription factor DksA
MGQTKVSKLSKQELSQYRKVLEHLVARLSGEVKQLRDEALGAVDQPASATFATDADHQGDAGTREAGEALALTLLGTEEQVLAEARAALDRIKNGSFGQCVLCSQPIAKPRLEAIPYTGYCIDCARANEARRVG